MSKLLNRPLRSFIIYASVVLLASIPVLFWAVDRIWRQELDENNDIIAERAIYQLRNVDFRLHPADSLFAFWNIIQPNSRLEYLPVNEPLPGDTTYTIYKQHVKPGYKLLKDRFQVLGRSFELNGRPCRIIVESNIEETYETVAVITLITGIFFVILSAGFIIMSRRMSDRIWAPFRDTLRRLKNFRVDEGRTAAFTKSGIAEFEELNAALEKLMARNIDVFRAQKEFTENASHELQTPLAVVQSKLGLLLQSDSISGEQFHLVEGANKALARAVRINKDQLLLARIANDQFVSKERIWIKEQVDEILDLLGHEFERKSIQLNTKLNDDAVLNANKFLLVTVLQNLLTNALRYCKPGGEVSIVATENQFMISNSGEKELNTSKLFQRFAILDEGNPSTGVGLALVRSICTQNEWDISYRFAAGSHRFNITFSTLSP